MGAWVGGGDSHCEDCAHAVEREALAELVAEDEADVAGEVLRRVIVVGGMCPPLLLLYQPLPLRRHRHGSWAAVELSSPTPRVS